MAKYGLKFFFNKILFFLFYFMIDYFRYNF